MRERCIHYWRLARLDRPVGWLLLLWPTLWALWIAGDGRPQPQIVLVFVLGVVTMRAAGCVINDYLDRDFDPHVARTRNRPLATGAVSPFEALILFAVLMTLSLGLVLTLNRETLVLAFAGGAIAVSYPLAKRFTYLPQVYLGLAFSWGIPMAFAAQDKAVGALAWSLVLANLLWTVAYDTMYAMADRPDDLKVGIKSSAILFGRFDLVINAVLQVLALVTLVLVGQYLGLNSWFYAGLAGAGATAIYQNRLCTERDRTQCLKAFLNNIWFGGFVFAGIVLAYI
jgi:4-hydroxybenzoate polyprenyltransferase